MNTVSPAALSVAQWCQALSMGKTKAHDLLAKGEIKSFTVGRKRLIPASEIERFIDNRMKVAQQ